MRLAYYHRSLRTRQPLPEFRTELGTRLRRAPWPDTRPFAELPSKSHLDLPGIFAQDGSKDWLDNISVHKVPAIAAGAVHFTGDGAGEAWAVNAKSPNKDLALKFIEYIFRPDVYNIRVKGVAPGYPRAYA